MVRHLETTIAAASGEVGLQNYTGHSEDLSERYIRKTNLSRSFSLPDFIDGRDRIDKMSFDMELRNVLPEFSDINKFRIPSERMESMSLEERVSRLYSSNSFGLWRWNPRGVEDPSISYVNLALDSPTISYSVKYNDFMVSRAESLFKNSAAFTPEELHELRRVADRLSTFQKVVDFDYFNYAAVTPITSILHHRVPADAFEPTVGSIVARAQNYMARADTAKLNCKLFIDEFPWYYRPYFFMVGLLGKIFGGINAYVGPYTEQGKDIFGKNTWIAGSIFDPRAPKLIFSNYKTSTKPASSGWGTSSAFTQKKEDPSQYFSDVNIYIGSLKPLSEYAGRTYVSLVNYYFQEMRSILTFSTIDVIADGGALHFLTFSVLFFILILVAVGMVFRSGTVVAVAIIFEAISICLVIIYAVIGVAWYDPMSSVFGLCIIMVSAVEMAILLSIFIVISR